MCYVYLFCLVVYCCLRKVLSYLPFKSGPGLFVSCSQALPQSTRYGGLNVVTATEESLEFPLNTALKED